MRVWRIDSGGMPAGRADQYFDYKRDFASPVSELLT